MKYFQLIRFVDVEHNIYLRRVRWAFERPYVIVKGKMFYIYPYVETVANAFPVWFPLTKMIRQYYNGNTNA